MKRPPEVKTDNVHDELERKIALAFCVPRPEHLVFGNAWEDADIEEGFSGISSPISHDDLHSRFYDSLANFTSAGFVWVISGYLLHAVRVPESQVADSLIDHLAGRNDTDLWKQRLDALTRDQRQTIHEVLSYLATRRTGPKDRSLQEALNKWGVV